MSEGQSPADFDPGSTLRDRIAAAIWNREATCECDRCVDSCEADADAIIAALIDADYVFFKRGHYLVSPDRHLRQAQKDLTQWGLENQPDE